MKNLVSILFIASYSFAFSQFDKIVADPLLVHPSFAGNTGKKRISSFYAFEKRRNTQVISYDFFSQKLKGAWGVRVANHRFYFNNEANFKIVYSPKFTSRIKKKTWAPALSVDYSSFYKYRHEEIMYFKDYESLVESGMLVRKALNFGLSLSRNSNKSLLAMTINVDPILKAYTADLSYFYKFDKNNLNKLSSTVSLSNKFLMSKSFFVEGILGERLSIALHDFASQEQVYYAPVDNLQNRLIWSYALKYSKLVFQLEADLEFYKKNRAVQLSADDYKLWFEKYNYYSKNSFGGVLGLNLDKLTFYSAIHYSLWNGLGRTSSPTAFQDNYITRKLSFGMNYTF